MSISVLGQPAPGHHENNNHSCVVVIRYGQWSVVLPGDIEAGVERALLAKDLLPEGVTLLVAPHHGSKTSSSADFVARLKPQWVVYAAGFNNRYGHPHADVQARYRAVGARGLHSGASGQISFTWEADTGPRVALWRRDHRRYWHRPDFAHGP